MSENECSQVPHSEMVENALRLSDGDESFKDNIAWPPRWVGIILSKEVRALRARVAELEAKLYATTGKLVEVANERDEAVAKLAAYPTGSQRVNMLDRERIERLRSVAKAGTDLYALCGKAWGANAIPVELGFMQVALAELKEGDL